MSEVSTVPEIGDPEQLSDAPGVSRKSRDSAINGSESGNHEEVPVSADDLARSHLRKGRTAMLLIHGIGEQNPYETLDSFARNLANYFKTRCGFQPEIQPERIAHEDWVETCIHLSTANRGPGAGKGEIDLYEYYWAPYTEGKITYREALAWLIKADLSPIRHFSDNVQLEQAAEVAKEAEKKREPNRILSQKATDVFMREIRRILWLYLPVLGAIILLAWLATRDTDWGKVYADVSGALKGRSGFVRMCVTGFLGAAAVMGYVLVSTLKEWHPKKSISTLWKWRGKQNAIATASERVGTLLAFLSVVFVALAWTTADLGGIGWANYWKSIIWHLATLELFVTALLVAALRYFLTAYVGDIAVYVHADAKAKNYEARTKILKESTLALTRILKDAGRKYEQVIVAGHSLGSVIAYDTIDELLNESSGKDDQLKPKDPKQRITQEDLKKLTGLVTFGSPLDKVYYFFREQVAPEQAIRAQILSYLHSFRKLTSGREYGTYRFTPYNNWEPPELRWLNAWSSRDIVSGRLHFYKVDNRKEFHYRQPVFAHLQYWKDPEFYGFIASNLLLVVEKQAEKVEEALLAGAHAA